VRFIVLKVLKQDYECDCPFVPFRTKYSDGHNSSFSYFVGIELYSSFPMTGKYTYPLTLSEVYMNVCVCVCARARLCKVFNLPHEYGRFD